MVKAPLETSAEGDVIIKILAPAPPRLRRRERVGRRRRLDRRRRRVVGAAALKIPRQHARGSAHRVLERRELLLQLAFVIEVFIARADQVDRAKRRDAHGLQQFEYAVLREVKRDHREVRHDLPRHAQPGARRKEVYEHHVEKNNAAL